jgi:hypothetical protein
MKHTTVSCSDYIYYLVLSEKRILYIFFTNYKTVVLGLSTMGSLVAIETNARMNVTTSLKVSSWKEFKFLGPSFAISSTLQNASK